VTGSYAEARTCTAAISGPNDPGYAPAERDPNGGMTFNVEQWYLYDCIPQSAPNAFDPEGAAGMSVNRAWATYGFGRSDVVVAYIEGGINWRRGESFDLRRKAYLNCGELPAPEKADGSTVPGSSPGCLESSRSYDLDGDGALTVDDYTNDPRVHRPFLHQQTAGGITAEDLIVAFSDGKDDDHNGYVDDISGWNFLRDTNDPQTDNSVYPHANIASSEAVAEANNNFGLAGVCPGCRLLSIKSDDDANGRPDRLAEGILFAVDSGAKVIDATVVALGQTPTVREAVEYAYDNGVVVVFGSNDFDSAAHTEGMGYPHVWPGNSLVSDQTHSPQSLPSDLTAVTFRSRSTATSFGPHALFSAPNRDGTSSSAIQAGVAAMVVSAGLDAAQAHKSRWSLDANEVFQVVRSTASPIDSTPCPGCFPGLGGAEFNIQYGYGRPNLFKAMKAAHAGRIPPTADIAAPEWYTEVDPTVSSSVPVTFTVAARRAKSYTWKLQYGLGPEPLDKDFKTIARGSGRGTARQLTRSLDLSKIPSSFWSGSYVAPSADRLSIERYDVTIRVQVRGRGLVGEDRRVFHLRHDDSVRPGFPKFLRTSLDFGATLADIEGRGAPDLVVPGSDGTLHVLRPDTSEAPGFPVQTGLARGVDPSYPYNYLAARSWRSGTITLPHDGFSGPVAVGDLNHTGELDIVGTTYDGFVYAWGGAGALLPGFPVSTDRQFARQSVPPPDTPYSTNPMTGAFEGPALADLEGTGKLDIIVSGWDGRVYAWRSDGTPVPGFPVDAADIASSAQPPSQINARSFKIMNTPTIVNADSSGHPDIFVGLQDVSFPSSGVPATTYLTGFSSTGTLLPGYPLQLTTLTQIYGGGLDSVTTGVQTGAALTLSGKALGIFSPELGFDYLIDLGAAIAHPFTPATIPAAGELEPAAQLVHFTTSPAVGNVLGGAALQVFEAGTALTDAANGLSLRPGAGIKIRSALAGWDAATGANLAQYTQPLQGLPFFSAPSIADLNGDGRPDIVIGADSAALHGFDGTTGQPLPGWPKWTGGWTTTAPAIGDLDNRGTVSVVVTTREGWVYVYDTPGLASANDQSFHWHGNNRMTGHFGDN